jgi:hypothetical protein
MRGPHTDRQRGGENLVRLKRQITDPEKAEVLARQGLRCFVDNHPVAEASELEFDHVLHFDTS